MACFFFGMKVLGLYLAEKTVFWLLAFFYFTIDFLKEILNF
jgi:hypothetical protein